MRLLAAALAGLSLVACGGSEQPTKEELVTKADAICAEHNDRMDALLAEVDQSWTDEQWKDFFKRWAGEHRQQVDDLADLEASDQAFKQYLARLERNADGYEQASDDVDFRSDAFLSKEYNSEQEARVLADKAGLQGCSPHD